ncbi:hypothetical protein [Paraburkholderia humisilvae]|uniref:Uncharacterized protein n=1 Tax=Paraburkholderia humisilvae TaxID=627669 RepID=A0A6J5F7I1_9BURK|nr:hypothetical protein [Paraburkholderia humisilvae]CAB3773245.1 hypothetical protein LMG29542_07156 [Paraburkholderia humisilvae]
MKTQKLAWMFLGVTHASVACGLLGVVDQVSSDGQYITSRKLVALVEEARRQGGFEQAARDMAQMHRDFMNSDRLSSRVRRRVDIDYSKNVGLLNCWVAMCTDRPGDPDCQF